MIELTAFQHNFVSDNKTSSLDLMTGYGGGKTFAGLFKCMQMLQSSGNAIFVSVDDSMLKHAMLEAKNVAGQSGIAVSMSKLHRTLTIGDSILFFETVESKADYSKRNVHLVIVEDIDSLCYTHFLSIIDKYAAVAKQLCFTFSPLFIDGVLSVYIQATYASVDKRLIQGSLRKAPFLPQGFIESLTKQYNYPEEYIEGIFCKTTL